MTFAVCCLTALLTLGAPQVETSETPTTRLYIRTTPPDAKVRLDGEPLGQSGGQSGRLFVVPAGVRRITVELDGHQPQEQQIEIRDGEITRVSIDLKRHPQDGSPVAPRPSPASSHSESEGALAAASGIPEGAVCLSYDEGIAEGRRSLGGTKVAVRFQRPAAAKYLQAIQIFASRYGTSVAPKEDFHVYLLDKDQKVLRDLTYPYATILRGDGLVHRSDNRWYTLPVPSVEVPEEFLVVLWFNSTEKKGVYLGMIRGVKESHSFVGHPDAALLPVSDSFDWMVRVYLTPESEKTK